MRRSYLRGHYCRVAFEVVQSRNLTLVMNTHALLLSVFHSQDSDSRIAERARPVAAWPASRGKCQNDCRAVTNVFSTIEHRRHRRPSRQLATSHASLSLSRPRGMDVTTRPHVLVSPEILDQMALPGSTQIDAERNPKQIKLKIAHR